MAAQHWPLRSHTRLQKSFGATKRTCCRQPNSSYHKTRHVLVGGEGGGGKRWGGGRGDSIVDEFETNVDC